MAGRMGGCDQGRRERHVTDRRMAMPVLVASAGFPGILAWIVRRIGLIAIIGITPALWDFFAHAGCGSRKPRAPHPHPCPAALSCY